MGLPLVFACVITLVMGLPAQAQPELLRLAIAGPATWRTRLQPTDLGSMLATEAAEKIWRRYVGALDGELRGLRGADAAFARERARLLDYAGTLHIVAWLEQAEDALNVPRWSAAFVAEPDGHTDLVAMAAESEQWLQRLGDTSSNAWRDMRPGPPRVHEGRLVLVFAGDEDRERATARAMAFRGKAIDPRDVMRIELEVAPMLGLLRDRAWDRGLATDLLGAATQRITGTLGAFGPDLSAALRIEFAATGERGVFAALAPERNGVPRLSRLIPDDVSLHAAWQVDWAAAWRTFCTVLAGVSERSPEQARDRLQRQLGIDVGKAIVPLLRDDVLLVCDRGDPDDGAVPLARACLVVPVRDAAQLVEALEPVVKHLGGFAMRGDDGAWSCTFAEGLQLVVDEGLLCIGGTTHGAAIAAKVRDRAAAAGVPAAQADDAGAGVVGQGEVAVPPFASSELFPALRLVPLLFGVSFRLPARELLADEVTRWTPLLQQHRLGAAAMQLRTRPREVHLRISW